MAGPVHFAIVMVPAIAEKFLFLNVFAEKRIRISANTFDVGVNAPECRAKLKKVRRIFPKNTPYFFKNTP